MRPDGSPYGLHRVLRPAHALPQAAECLDVSLPPFDNEILIQVEQINVDSTSFKQLSEAAGRDSGRIAQDILRIARERGKLHNPVTNSGGMLIGRVEQVGMHYRGKLKAKPGDRIATLVSLTLTPLRLDSIDTIDLSTGQLRASGQAILFETGIAVPLPEDISERIALAVLDVCGAPALVLRHAKKGDRVLFVGAGKSAKLSAAALRQAWGDAVQIHAADPSAQSLEEMTVLGLADEAFALDATRVGHPALEGRYDLVVNVANAPGTEMFSILAARTRGKVLFFSMATDFSKVALGAEGVGKDADFLIGNGYAEGHAALALDVLRAHGPLRKWFEEKYS